MKRTSAEKALIIWIGVSRRAEKRFHEGNYKNPYKNHPWDCMQKGMYDAFEMRMQELLKERFCPCCGQMTLGDIDW